MSLTSFISSHEDEIIQEWEAFARTLLPAAEKMDSKMLRDHIRGLLRCIVMVMNAPAAQREREQVCKEPRAGEKEINAPEAHGEDRFRENFDLIQLHAEFRALRASILRLWTMQWSKSNKEWTTPAEVVTDLMRFNEIIDEMVSESLEGYLKGISQAISCGDKDLPEVIDQISH